VAPSRLDANIDTIEMFRQNPPLPGEQILDAGLEIVGLVRPEACPALRYGRQS